MHLIIEKLSLIYTQPKITEFRIKLEVALCVAKSRNRTRFAVYIYIYIYYNALQTTRDLRPLARKLIKYDDACVLVCVYGIVRGSRDMWIMMVRCTTGIWRLAAVHFWASALIICWPMTNWCMFCNVMWSPRKKFCIRMCICVSANQWGCWWLSGDNLAITFVRRW